MFSYYSELNSEAVFYWLRMNIPVVIIKYFSNLLDSMKMKLQKIGSSVFVRLPLDYVRAYNLREVRMINLKEDEHGNLVISPMEVV